VWWLVAACGPAPADPAVVPADAPPTEVPPAESLPERPAPPSAPVASAVPGVAAPGPVRKLARVDATWLQVSPDGRVGVASSFPGPRGGPTLTVLDLESGATHPLPPPRGGALWQPRFLDSDGRDWRVVALSEHSPTEERGLYSFRLGDPAGTWAPWAVTGTHVRDFWLVEDRTQVVLLSFRPDGRRDSDRLDVAPIVDGHPALDRVFRVAPEVQAIQDEVWDERAHRFGFWDLDARAALQVPLEAGAHAEPWPGGGNAQRWWNPRQAETDVVQVVRDGYAGADAVDATGARWRLLECDERVACTFLALSPARRELWFTRATGPDDGAVYVAGY
jgi:hypothetical protein